MKHAIAGLVAATVLASAAPADAHIRRTPTHIYITVANTATISGYIQSNATRCKANRTVTISTGGNPVTTATSDANGSWQSFAGFGLGVNYTASIDKLYLKKTRRHRHFCTASSYTKTTS